MNEELKEIVSAVEEIKIPRCIRKSHDNIINEEMKVSSSEEEEIGIRKCRRRSQVDIIKEEVKGWTSSSKQQEATPEPTNTKEDIHLEHMKIKVKRAALEWYGLVIQEQLKSLMYVDHSSHGHPNKDKFIDELNFKIFMRLKIKTTSKFFVVITYKKEILIFIQNMLMPTISSHIYLFRISNTNQI